MASTINPNNIDGAYPVAGQDNDSQGFRDNFTNTKTNFGYAAAEITDLQNKAILKSALTGTVLNNDMTGSILSNAQLQDMSETKVSLGSVSGSQTLNYAAGPYFTVITSGPISLNFSNLSVAGTVSRLRVQIQVTSVSHTVTLPAAVSVGVSNIQGLSNNIITFNQTGFYEFEFETSDSGATISIFDLNRNHDPIYLPSAQDLAPSTAASLTQTTSYFATAAAETATLAAGVAGQVKVLAMTANGGGDMVVTVTNAGWTGDAWSNIVEYKTGDRVVVNGISYISLQNANLNQNPVTQTAFWGQLGPSSTITFNTRGQACTLMYINSKWFCIGNNGAAFA